MIGEVFEREGNTTTELRTQPRDQYTQLLRTMMMIRIDEYPRQFYFNRRTVLKKNKSLL